MPGTVSRATQTEDDLSEIRADVKKIVEAVQSLIPQPQPKPPAPEFKVRCDPEPWCRAIRPTPDKVHSYIDGFLKCASRHSSEEDIFEFMVNGQVRRLGVGDHGLADVFRDHLPLVVGMRGISVDETRILAWKWLVDPSCSLDIVDLGRSGGSRPTYSKENTEKLDPIRISAHGYGTICTITPGQNRGHKGVLSYEAIILILAQCYRWNEPESQLFRPVDPMLDFLERFSQKCPPLHLRRQVTYSTMWYGIEDTRSQTIQTQFRCFNCVELDMGGLDAKDGVMHGLKINRERGQIKVQIPGLDSIVFEERRISIFGVLLSKSYNWHMPPFFSVIILSDVDCMFWGFLHSCENCSPTLAGINSFYEAIYGSIIGWQKQWNRVLDKIDECVRVRLQDTLNPQKVGLWMLDDGERSKLYVTTLQILRIFGEEIRASSGAMGPLDMIVESFRHRNNLSEDEDKTQRSNWEMVKNHWKQAEESLLARISQKTDEVKSLRDGLFSATSLREARRSASMGRYVLVFTVVTILYLPPSFISTVLDMQIFQKDTAQGKWEYKVSLVTVSLFTYLAAFVSIVAIDWQGFKHRSLRWWAAALGIWALVTPWWEPAKERCVRLWMDARKKARQFFGTRRVSSGMADGDIPLDERVEDSGHNAMDPVSSPVSSMSSMSSSYSSSGGSIGANYVAGGLTDTVGSEPYWPEPYQPHQSATGSRGSDLEMGLPQG